MGQGFLKNLGGFLKKTDRGTVAYLPPDGDREHHDWVYCLHNADYGFIFSVITEDEEVVDIQARDMDWVRRHIPFEEYVEPPSIVRKAVEERVGFAEDPNELAVMDEECGRCGEEYFVDVTPKIDLLIDGHYAQRIIEEYCPECSQPLIQRFTFNPPKKYVHESHNENAPPKHQFDPEEVDYSKHTWEHARR